MRSAAVFAALVALSACAAIPIRIALQDVTVDMSVLTNTQGQVLYPTSPSAFQKASVHVASASVDGDITAHNLSGSTTFTFYGRVKDPIQDSTCTPIPATSYVSCPAGQEAAIGGPITLTSNGTASSLHLAGGVLAEAAKQGQIWIGAAVQGSTSAGVSLDFTHLVANVTLF